MLRHVFINLPVRDVAAATAFYEALGFGRNAMFSTDTTVMVDVEENIKLLLHSEERFAEFLAGPRATGTEVLVALSAESKEAVEAMSAAAKAAGGGDWLPPQDHGFMYGVSFTDLDGHVVEVAWMDVEAAMAGATADSDAG